MALAASGQNSRRQDGDAAVLQDIGVLHVVQVEGRGDILSLEVEAERRKMVIIDEPDVLTRGAERLGGKWVPGRTI